jgi:hypothetical protein
MKSTLVLATTLLLVLCGCEGSDTPPKPDTEAADKLTLRADLDHRRLSIYTPVSLSADLDHLSEQQRKMLPLLIEASKIMEELFWQQAFGNKQDLLSQIENDDARAFAAINFGPWDRLDGNKPFLDGVADKPAGAKFYPEDMSKAEFEAWQEPNKKHLYSFVRRTQEGQLQLEPYNQIFADQLQAAAELLEQAALLAEDADFKHYLQLRAQALTSNEYQASDMAWMDMRTNAIDVVIGPIETYEDQLYGYRAAFSSYVLIKDQEWSQRLSRFTSLLPELQKNLPVAEAYKAEQPGSNSQLNAYDVIFYAGDSNAGAKTIAINLPNDEEVQLAKGTRRLQLKNAMRAKFDKILLPIADVLIDESQRSHITFDAFFSNTMFHEVAHGLGIKRTLESKEYVRQALKETASSLEEGKADILGLYMVKQLTEMGELDQEKLQDNYVTFMAGIFRSIRFGASSAHGKANMIRFNFFRELGAFERDPESGTYKINEQKFEQAIAELSSLILTIQGDGNYEAALNLIRDYGSIDAELQADLDRLVSAEIPVDIVFNQGADILRLQ